jgi:thiol-disulfide isomerase/thioredoxin
MTITFSAAAPLRALAGALLAAAAFATLPAFAIERVEPWPARTPTPALALADLDGRPWQLDALRGKVVLLHFWASWCESCVDELPQLDALAARGPAAGLVLLSVNYRDSAATLASFTAAHPAAYPILRDRTGETFKRWGGIVMPLTILIDRGGQARWRMNGPLAGAGPAFDTALTQLLAQPASPQP